MSIAEEREALGFLHDRWRCRDRGRCADAIILNLVDAGGDGAVIALSGHSPVASKNHAAAWVREHPSANGITKRIARELFWRFVGGGL